MPSHFFPYYWGPVISRTATEAVPPMENEFRKNAQGFAANGPNPSLAPAFPAYPVVDNQQNNGSQQGGNEAHRP